MPAMFHYRSESTPAGNDPEKLRRLAHDAGYSAERAHRRNHWHLIAPGGEPAIDPRTRSTAFAYRDALAFLRQRLGKRTA
jgi:hypothetical protein